MSDQQPTSPTLSQIGHLFLSSVRQRHTEGAPMPRRQPPGAPRQPVMVTVPLREADRVAPAAEPVVEESPAIDTEPVKFPPVTALLSAHLNGRQRERVWAYARHLASSRGQRIGLVELGAAEFRVTCFEPLAPEARDEALIDESPAEEAFDGRVVAEALEEMSWDVDRWLLLMPAGVRAWEAKCLLRDVGHWALLGTCDHDGVVSCYRTLKGLNPGGEDWPRPRLTLALLECADEVEAESVHRKLSGVSQQFLGLPLEAEAPVQEADDVAEHPVMFCRLPRPTTAGEKNAVGPHWQVVADFVAKAKAGRPQDVQVTTKFPQIESKPMFEPKPAAVMNEPIELAAAPVAAPAAPVAPAAPATMRWTGGDLASAPVVSEVIDLPDASPGSAGILTAVLKSEASSLLECPITPPACPQAKLAVGRDRRLVLLAVGHQGLADLRTIGKAYQWLYENRSLIAMALPQAAIDANAAPQLRLFVDHADLNAAALQPMLQAGTVTVQAYRRLRWGGRNGLLLEAA